MENDTNNVDINNLIETSQPFYLYKDPMFMVTVSVVTIIENGVVMLAEDCVLKPSLEELEEGKTQIAYDSCRFPGGQVKAGQETIQFSAIRQIKEQTGIALKKDDLIPVDFRSDPERSKGKNVIDIGMVCMPNISHDFVLKNNAKLISVDFDKKTFVDEHTQFYMDHKLLLERAIDIALLMK